MTGKQVMIRCKSAFILAAMVLISSVFPICLGTDEVEATDALSSAEDSLSSAYLAVMNAETAGADISKLQETLNTAGNSLADAYNTYRTGNFSMAVLYANDCINKVNGVTSEAMTLKLIAEEAYTRRLLTTTGVSITVLCALFVLSLWGWRVMKKRYLKKVLEMKPEVGELK